MVLALLMTNMHYNRQHCNHMLAQKVQFSWPQTALNETFCVPFLSSGLITVLNMQRGGLLQVGILKANASSHLLSVESPNES